MGNPLVLVLESEQNQRVLSAVLTGFVCRVESFDTQVKALLYLHGIDDKDGRDALLAGAVLIEAAALDPGGKVRHIFKRTTRILLVPRFDSNTADYIRFHRDPLNAAELDKLLATVLKRRASFDDAVAGYVKADVDLSALAIRYVNLRDECDRVHAVILKAQATLAAAERTLLAFPDGKARLEKLRPPL